MVRFGERVGKLGAGERKEKQMAKGLGWLAAVVLAVVVLLAGAGCKKEQGGEKKEVKASGSQAAPAVKESAKGAEEAGKTAEEEEEAAAEEKEGAEGPAGMPSMQDLAKQAEETKRRLAEINEVKVVEAVDFRKLKELLPESLAGLKRTDAQGERTKAMGMDTSEATGQYEGQGENAAQVRVKLQDMGNLSGTMMAGYGAWTMMEYDRDTDTGYEKTISYKGYRGVEEYDKENQRGSIRILVSKRFMVEVEGDNTTIEKVKEAMDGIDLSKVEALGK